MSVVSTVPGTVATYQSSSRNTDRESCAPSAVTFGPSASFQDESVHTSRSDSRSSAVDDTGGVAMGLEKGALPRGSVHGSCGSRSPRQDFNCHGQPTPTW